MRRSDEGEGGKPQTVVKFEPGENVDFVGNIRGVLQCIPVLDAKGSERAC